VARWSALIAIAACSSRKTDEPPPRPPPPPVEAQPADPPIELPVVVTNPDVGAAMHTQASVETDYDAWCKQRATATCSRTKRTGDGNHQAEVYRRGSEVVLAINTMRGMTTAATPIRLAGEPDAIDLAVTKTDGGIPVWDALLTVHQGTTWYAQACSWSGDPEGCTLPIASQTAAPKLDGTRLVVRGASVIHDGKREPMPDQTYVMFVP
jgi:hypothetical protein